MTAGLKASTAQAKSHCALAGCDGYLRRDVLHRGATDARDWYPHRAGAPRRDTLNPVLFQALQITVAGVAVGVAAAFGLTRLLNA